MVITAIVTDIIKAAIEYRTTFCNSGSFPDAKVMASVAATSVASIADATVNKMRY